jgi:tRNA(Arg) A34 adenosine deaminase TadA
MEFTLTLPHWFSEELGRHPVFLPTREERMRMIIRFAELNFENDTGGPFAAGVFERETGKRIAIGVNRVVPSNCSAAHAEIMALSLAQRRLATFDLGGPGMAPHELVVNWRPCAMCYGAVLWSGVRSLVIAGSDDELEKLTGFDEGPIHPNWQAELRKRSVDLYDQVLREEALQVFQAFADSGALVYGGRRGD